MCFYIFFCLLRQVLIIEVWTLVLPSFFSFEETKIKSSITSVWGGRLEESGELELSVRPLPSE